MDRVYYQLIEEAIDITRLSTAVVRNADYKQVIKAATDPLIIDAIKDLHRTNKMLQEVLNRQEHANVLSMPT